MNYVIKRDNSVIPFDKNKIITAIQNAYKEVKPFSKDATRIANYIANRIEQVPSDCHVEEIQNLVETHLMALDKIVAKAYIIYRYKRSVVREFNTTDKEIMELLNGENEYLKTENSNKDATNITVQRDYIAGITSKDITERYLLPNDVVKAHKEGIIHFHDTDYFAQRTLHNCSLINLKDMLQNGTVISGTMIEKPHSFATACNIATQIIAQVASSQYGGQSISLAHLAPFVDISRKRYIEEIKSEIEPFKSRFSPTEYIDYVNKTAEKRVMKEIKSGVQTIQYQIITLMTTNGQAPFLSIFMYLNEVEDEQTKHDLALIIEEVLKQRIQGVKNETGAWITPAFPKLLYVLEEDNITEDSKYWYLTELSAKCSAKRLVPDYISEKIMLEQKEGNVFPCMGCRSFLSPYKDEDGNYKFYGRFNEGVVTLNLVDIALSSKGDFDEFWRIFDERTELCHKALMCRHKRLEGTSSDVAPILWQHGAMARLKKGEKIDKLLHNGYSTISLGYAGLYECVKYMTGFSHTDDGIGYQFAMEVMKALNKKCDEWNAQHNIGFSIYGSPIESTTYKFAKCLKERFGIIDGITDKDYITNSYHVPVFEKIDAFSKLELESKFQSLSTGGAISYVEMPDMTQNIEAVLMIIKFIYDNIMYAELNTKSDYCQVCGYDGEISLIDENGELIWECPNCGNRDHNKLNVARRTCG